MTILAQRTRHRINQRKRKERPSSTRNTSQKSSRPDELDKASLAIKPKRVIPKIEAMGFEASVNWKESSIEPGWVGIWHLHNSEVKSSGDPTDVGENLDELTNETNCQLFGPTKNAVKKAIVEVEIYNRKFKSTTLENGCRCLKLLGASENVIAAFGDERETKVDSWQIVYRAHPRGGGYDVTCTNTFSAGAATDKPIPKRATKRKANPRLKEAKSAADNVRRYRTRLNAGGLNERIITRLSANGLKVTITVVDVWSDMDYGSRLQAADTLYKLWALVASPGSPDSARISIVNENGVEIGGSRMLAGSLIWVQK